VPSASPARSSSPTSRTDGARPRVVTIGGGTGQFALLSGLRTLDVHLTAIVTMMDSGGSSGRLRDEYGILPPGDFTRCLIALSHHPTAMKELLTHRFTGGSLDGHTVRNVIFTALEQVTGDTVHTIERLHEVFDVGGRVLPVTLDRVELVMSLVNGKVHRGEATIDGLIDMLEAPVRDVRLDPAAAGFPPALEAVRDADVIVLGPGDLFTSVVPNLLVGGVAEAIRASRARIVYVCNLMTKRNETPGFTVLDFAATIDHYLGGHPLDAVLYNEVWPTHQLELYASVGSRPVELGEVASGRWSDLCVGGDLLSEGRFIRHDPGKLASAIAGLALSRGWLDDQHR
jgi:uncharacterized cofD-like protein